MRKLKVFASLIWASLPLFVAAQSNDDLYFVPKKKAETKKETVVAPKQNQGTAVYSTSATSTPVVVKDAAGNTRDVDEYNRRYTSRETRSPCRTIRFTYRKNRMESGENG